MTLSGDLPTLNADVAGDATATATAAMDSEHAAAAAVDGDASTYWSAQKLWDAWKVVFEKVEVNRYGR